MQRSHNVEQPTPMLLSVVVPARNEEGCLAETVQNIGRVLGSAGIPYEVVIVDDGSSDATLAVAAQLATSNPRVFVTQNRSRNGFGLAVREGLARAQGEAVAIVMADGSDSPEDLVRYHAKLQEGYECVFGSRFIRGAKVVGYPTHKLVLNRLANWLIRLLFRLDCNDITNAFKCYRRNVVQAMYPLISPHFNLTVEMPLKAVVRGFRYAVIPISWTNRKSGVSKLKLQEMGSRYLFIVLYLWLEKHLSRGDYHRSARQPEPTSSDPLNV